MKPARGNALALVFGCGLGLGVAIGAGIAEYAGPVGAWGAAVAVMGAVIAWDFRKRRTARRARSAPTGPALTDCNQTVE